MRAPGYFPIQFRVSQNKIIKIQQYTFSLSDFIGKGNFANVYKAFNTKTSQIVAIKVIDLSNPMHKNLETFVMEQISILKKLKHPNIIKFHQAILESQKCYIVTELCKEGNLEGRIKWKKGLREEELTDIIGEVYQGLRYLRQMGVCHRDIKAANIFMKGGRAKIADFGLARFYKQGFKDMDVGSPLFMSPEGIIMNTYGEKTDIWAFGIFIYQLLHGVAPFIDCKTTTALRNAVSAPIPEYKFIPTIKPDLRGLINILLTIDEHKRPSVEGLQNNAYIKSCVQKGSSKRGPSGLNVVQRSKIMSQRGRRAQTDYHSSKEIIGKIQIIGDTKPTKRVLFNQQSQKNDENGSIQAYSSHEIQIPRSFLSKHPKTFQIPQTNRNLAATSKQIRDHLKCPQTTRFGQDLRRIMNSSKTIQTKDSEQQNLIRRKEVQFHPFFRK